MRVRITTLEKEAEREAELRETLVERLREERTQMKRLSFEVERFQKYRVCFSKVHVVMSLQPPCFC
jgi:hypothetical protein